MTTIRKILITDQDTVFGMGLRVLLAAQPGFDVISEPGNGSDVLDLVRTLTPDLVMTDLKVPEPNDSSQIAAIRSEHPDTKVLVVTQHRSEESIRAALWAGATGYVPKETSNSEFLVAVRSVLAGKVYLSPSLSDKIINAFLLGGKSPGEKPQLDILTDRERQILKLVAEGHTNRRVAAHLNLSIKTVEKHRSNLMRKLDLHSVSALTTFAIGQGLIGTGN